MRREEIDLADVVRETVESFSGRASSLGITLEASTDDHVEARLDRARIRQAVGNLVDNALRHTPAGGRVTVAISRTEQGTSILVSDTGPGFADAVLPHAFEAFARADGPRSSPAEGAGLGLAIVRAVAEAHGGTVEAANGRQGGAVVVLSVPA